MNQNASSVALPLTPEDQRIHDIKVIVQFTTCPPIIPIQCLALFASEFFSLEFHRNASYLIVARLIFLDLLQSLALLITGFYQIFPQFPDQFVVLRKICGVILTCFFLQLFPLQLELTIYRMLVVTGKCKPTRLPFPIMIVEGLCWLFVIALSIGTYIQDSRLFADERWYYDLDKSFGRLLSDLEIYFCVPLLLVTNILYTFLISMIFLKNKKFTRNKDKKDVSLYLQSVTYTFSHVLNIALIHLIDICEPCDSPYLFIVVKFIYNTGFYWTALFLLLFNESIRSKIWRGTRIDVISESACL